MLPPDMFGCVFDRLVADGDFKALACLLVASKPARDAESDHKYAQVILTVREEPPPTSWFLQRTGRIAHVDYTPYEQHDGDDAVQTEYLDVFAACGATVFLRTNRAYPHCNIIGAELYFFGFDWTTDGSRTSDVEQLVEMMTNNPTAQVKLEQYEGVQLEKAQVVRRIADAEVLVPIASRIDMSSFIIWYGGSWTLPEGTCSNEIGVWARAMFPSAVVVWAQPPWRFWDDDDDSAVEGGIDWDEDEGE